MSLDLRNRPVQKRSAATFDHILETAIHLLEQEGWDGFNTNLLAERSGIGIQTLYRYFPNKLSVVATLAQRVIEEWDDWFQDLENFFTDDYSLGSERAFRHFIDGLRNQPGGVAIRRAMGASTALRELDREDNRRMAKRYSEAFSKKLGKGKPEDFFLFFLMTIETSVAIVDFALDLPIDEAEKVIEEYIAMQSRYFREKARQFEEELT